MHKSYIYDHFFDKFIIFFLFSFMTAQSAGASGNNAKMMNFGKSRAQRIDPDAPNSKRFRDVAGLKEENNQNSDLTVSKHEGQKE